jgi:hypothetical protein
MFFRTAEKTRFHQIQEEFSNLHQDACKTLMEEKNLSDEIRIAKEKKRYTGVETMTNEDIQKRIVCTFDNNWL